MSSEDLPESIVPTPALPPEDGASQPARGGSALVSWLREIVGVFLPAIILALLLNNFVAQNTYVLGQSMEPNLHENQRLMVEKITYRFDTPRRGDIVVLDLEGFELPLIKRVIALPGESIEIKGNLVYINGVALDEPYLDSIRQRNYGPLTVPPDSIFVLGDNRPLSNDSRYFGPVSIDSVIGRAWISYWPPEEIHLVH